MTLRQKQSRFARLAAALIIRAEAMGFEVTLGEAYRSPEEASRLASTGAGIRRSLHQDRLAIDLNLFKDGLFLSATDAHRPLGEWWEQQSSDDLTCRWGGRFSRPDGNHYSIEHEGRA